MVRMNLDERVTDYNKAIAIVDYTSPALCTSVTPFPPIGDAAYRQHAGGGPSHGHGQHAQKVVRIAGMTPEISSRTDRHRQTYSSQYFATAAAGQVMMTSTESIIVVSRKKRLVG